MEEDADMKPDEGAEEVKAEQALIASKPEAEQVPI